MADRRPAQRALEASPPCPPVVPPKMPWDMLYAIWQSRACYICREYGECNHREPRVELAELEAFAHRCNIGG